MSQDEQVTKAKLSVLWKNDRVLTLETRGEKYAIFSDLHLGDGSGADDFHKNEETFVTALASYLDQDYNLVFLGDSEEFWQFDLEKIIERYNNSVYKSVKKFGNDRFFRVFGNHDREWEGLKDPAKKNQRRSYGAHEALKMKDKNGDVKILLVHGHQGSVESDKTSWFSRFWVRMFKPVEPFIKSIGITTHPEATKSQIVTNYEQIFYSWAKKEKAIIICGHSHRAIFASRSRADELSDQIHELQAKIYMERTDRDAVKKSLKKLRKLVREKTHEESRNRDIDPVDDDPLPCYFNTGCGLYSNGITAIEIDDDNIRLVKWHRDKTKDPRFVMYKKGNLSEFISEIS